MPSSVLRYWYFFVEFSCCFLQKEAISNLNYKNPNFYKMFISLQYLPCAKILSGNSLVLVCYMFLKLGLVSKLFLTKWNICFVIRQKKVYISYGYKIPEKSVYEPQILNERPTFSHSALAFKRRHGQTAWDGAFSYKIDVLKSQGYQTWITVQANRQVLMCFKREAEDSISNTFFLLVFFFFKGYKDVWREKKLFWRPKFKYFWMNIHSGKFLAWHLESLQNKNWFWRSMKQKLTLNWTHTLIYNGSALPQKWINPLT